MGGGFAGLATAKSLVDLGADVVVLEAEAQPGAHSSGRNAAIARRLVEELPVARLAVESMRLMWQLATPDGYPVVRKTGGILLGDEHLLERLWGVAQAIPELASDARRLSSNQVLGRVPALAGARLAGAIHVQGDGVVDIHALLQSMLARLKGRVFTSTPVTAIKTAGGRVTAVETAQGSIATGSVVDAAGFHANRVAALAGLGPLPFQPVRRHLFTTEPTDVVAPEAPWVWDGTTGFYFRREGAGLLMCACDQTPWPDDAPIDAPVDPEARQWLADKYDSAVPGLRDVRPSHGWAGLRILTPDHRFVIGHDPRLSGFTWVAGLGGHGMTTACGVGELAAALFETGELPDDYADAFDPRRFL